MAALLRLSQAHSNAQLRQTTSSNPIGRALIHPGRTFGRYSNYQNRQALASLSDPGGVKKIYKATIAPTTVVREATKGNLHPLGKTIKDLGIFAATSPAGVIQAAADPVGAAQALSRDLNRRYNASPSEIRRRAKKEGAAAEIADILTVAAPSLAASGRGVGATARSGALGERARRVVSEPRPDLRVSGNKTRAQQTSPDFYRAVGQALEDTARARRVQRRNTRAAKRGRGKPGIQPRTQGDALHDANQNVFRHLQRAARAHRAGDARGERAAMREAERADAQFKRAQARRPGTRAEVVPIFEKRAQRIATAETQSRYYQRQRRQRRQEVTGPRHSTLATFSELPKRTRNAVTLAVKGGMPLEREAAVHWLRAVRDRMLEEHKATGREGRPRGVKQIDDLIVNADKVDFAALARVQPREVERTRRLEATERELTPGTQRAAAARAQAFTVEAATGRRIPNRYEQQLAEFTSGQRRKLFAQARREQARTGSRVRTAERRLGTARQREAYRHGRAAEAVGRVDRTLLRRDRPYRAAAHELSRAQKELRAARAQFGNAARNRKRYTADELTHSLERRRSAERRVERARADYRQVRTEAEQRVMAGQAPVGKNRSLERESGKVLEAQQRVQRAKVRAEEAKQAVRRARHDKSPKARRELDARKGELLDEFADAVAASAREFGLPEAGYVKDFKHRTQVDSRSPKALGGAKAAPNVKRSELALFSTGRADLSPEAYLQSLSETIKRQQNHALIEEQASIHSLPTPSPEEIKAAIGRDVSPERLTRDHWAQILEHRDWDPASWRAWSPGEFRSAIRNTDTFDPQEFQTALEAGFNPGKDVQGVQMVPSEVFQEIAAGKGNSTIGRLVDKVLGAQAGFILGLSPKWAAFQIAANAFLSGFALRGNVFGFVKGPLEWERAFTPELRERAREMFGTGAGHSHARQRTQLGAAVDDTGLLGWGRAWQEAAGITYRQRKNRVPGVRRLEGNPLFQLDDRQNEFFKKVVFTSEVKRLAWEQMQQEAGVVNTALARIQHVLTLGPKERMRRVTEDPELFERAMRSTDDFLGNYVRYTAKERAGIRRVALFYGFMRYALRTTFYTAPVKHPIMASIVLKLSQLHKREVDELFGGDPLPWTYGRLFFGSHSPLSLLPYGEKVPGGAGLYSIDVGRMSPTQSVATDLGTEGTQALASVFLSPFAQSLANVFLYKKDLFTGQPLKYGGSTGERGLPTKAKGRILLNDLLSLAAPYREAVRITQPYKATPDTLLWSPQPVKYKDPEKRREQRRRRRQAGSVGEQVLGALFAPYPVVDTSRDIIRGRQPQKKRKGGNSLGFPGGSSDNPLGF